MTALRPASIALILLVIAFIPVRVFDHDVFRLLNGSHSHETDVIWLAFTTMGDGLLMGVILAAFIVRKPRITALGVTLLVTSAALVHLLKWLVPEARPAAVLQSVHVIGPLLRSGSFPSGHTAAGLSAGLAVACFMDSRVLKLGAIAAGALIGLSRVFVGAHFPSDVIGGAICALVVYIAIPDRGFRALERFIPEPPAFTSKWFKVAFALEALLAVVAVAIWGPWAAELPEMGVAVGVAALLALAFGGQPTPEGVGENQ